MKLFRTMSIVLMLTISVGIIVGSNHSEAVSDPALLRAFPDGEEKRTSHRNTYMNLTVSL